MASFAIDISYSQVAVFDSTLALPFNDWTEAQVRQGFSWRPGSVSFRTLTDAGPVIVDILCARTLEEGASVASRVIEVPFTVGGNGAIEVASISCAVSFELPAGEYSLTFEHGLTPEQTMWANLYFRLVTKPVTPRILRADSALSPPSALIMDAEPA